MIRSTNFRIYGFYRKPSGSMGILLKDEISRYPIMADDTHCMIASPYNMEGMKKTRKIKKSEALNLVDDLKKNLCMRDYKITVEDIHEFVKTHRKDEK